MQTVPSLSIRSNPIPLKNVHLSLISGIGMLNLTNPTFYNLLTCFISCASLQNGKQAVYNFTKYAKYKKLLTFVDSIPLDFIYKNVSLVRTANVHRSSISTILHPSFPEFEIARIA